MRIAFRVDASVQIGLGHLTRCLSLASALRAYGSEVMFVTRALGLDDRSWVAAAGFMHIQLPAPTDRDSLLLSNDVPTHAGWAKVDWRLDVAQTVRALADFRPNWIIVDHYAFDAKWHRATADSTGAKICAIDDLADRALAADVIVDQNVASDHRVKYAGVAIGNVRILGGPRYALLDPSYTVASRYVFRDPVRSVGIFMGGSDPLRLSERVLRACREIAGFNGLVEIATTRANPALVTLGEACKRYGPAELLVDASNLVTFYARHDLQIGAGGGAMWERCYMGVPAVVVPFAANQRLVAAALAETGAIKVAKSLDPVDIGYAVRSLLDAPDVRRRMVEHSQKLVDGRGAQRVALALSADTLTLRPARLEDAETAYCWRNDERTRRYFRDPRPVLRETHIRWWARSLSDNRRALLVAECAGYPVGVVRLDEVGDAAAEVSLYFDPELTRLGLGTAALKALQLFIIESRPNLSRLLATVLPENVGSVRAFAGAGFARLSDSEWCWERKR